jgi:hypothetical protein
MEIKGHPYLINRFFRSLFSDPAKKSRNKDEHQTRVTLANIASARSAKGYLKCAGIFSAIDLPFVSSEHGQPVAHATPKSRGFN